MLHILLVILKIIGIILLVLLLLLLTVTLAVMLVPIRYRLDGRKTISETWGNGKLSWLLHLITVRAQYQEGELDVTLRILGIPKKLYPFPEKGPEKSPEDEDGDLPAETDIDEADELISEQQEPRQISAESPPRKSPTAAVKPPDPLKKPPTREVLPEQTSRLRTLLNKIRRIWDNICSIPQKAKKALLRALRTRDKLLEKLAILKGDMTRAVLGRFKEYFFYLWKHSRPRKLTGKLHFGFDDPALTGVSHGIFGLLFAGMNYPVVLDPDFDQVVFEGELMMKGRIRAVHLARIGWKLFRDKELRQVIKNIKK